MRWWSWFAVGLVGGVVVLVVIGILIGRQPDSEPPPVSRDPTPIQLAEEQPTEPRMVLDGEEFGQALWERRQRVDAALFGQDTAVGELGSQADLEHVVATLDAAIGESRADWARLRAAAGTVDQRSREMIWLLAEVLEAESMMFSLILQDYRLCLEATLAGEPCADADAVFLEEFDTAVARYEQAAKAVNDEIRERAASPGGLRRP